MLDIHDNQLTSLSVCQQLPKLKYLNAATNSISELCSLLHLTNLVELQLNGNAITSLAQPLPGPHVGMQQQYMTSTNASLLPMSLRHLQLAHNQLHSVTALGSLKQLTGLQALSVQGNPFTRHQLPGSTHREVTLQCCPITLTSLDNKAVSASGGSRRACECRCVEPCKHSISMGVVPVMAVAASCPCNLSMQHTIDWPDDV